MFVINAISKKMHSEPEFQRLYEQKTEAYNSVIELFDNYGIGCESILKLVVAVEEYENFRFKYLTNKLIEKM